MRYLHFYKTMYQNCKNFFLCKIKLSFMLDDYKLGFCIGRVVQDISKLYQVGTIFSCLWLFLLFQNIKHSFTVPTQHSLVIQITRNHPRYFPNTLCCMGQCPLRATAVQLSWDSSVRDLNASHWVALFLF